MTEVELLEKVLINLFTDKQDRLKTLGFLKEEIEEVRQISIHTYDPGSKITFMGENADHVMIQVSGIVVSTKYSEKGYSIQKNEFLSPQIFGLLELLTKESNYGTRLVAMTAVEMIYISNDLYKKAVESSLTVSGISLNYIASFAQRMLNQLDQQVENTGFEKLLIYIYERSSLVSLPYYLRETNRDIADHLQISERSIYRYLNKMEKLGLVTRKDRNVKVDKSNLEKLKLYIENIHTGTN